MTPTSASPSFVRRLGDLGLGLASRATWLPPLLTRIVIGVVFVLSGWGKLHNLGGPDGMIEYFRGLGIPAPEIQAPFAASTEFVAGLLVLVGLFTRLASVPLIIIMLVALKTAVFDPAKAVELGWFNYLFGLSEFLYIALLVWLVIAGPGALSLDRVVFGRRSARS